MSDSCLFCKIVSGDIPADIVHRDDHVVAFRDLNPQAPVHVLLVPRRHVATVNDLRAEHADDLAALLGAAPMVARDQGVADDGYRLVINCLEGAGQSVFHLHLHLLGGRSFGWPPG